ncbi:hypothetical protein [Xanthomonas albilineans]|uniref:hypothetical protein n=1 Tax=Xanthomonas albilineans TaxID=29447 RepID=UPI0011B0F400|nr:hypothetical protein [Xanthomonas albilineans]
MSARHALFEAVARVFMCDDGLRNRALCACILLLKAIPGEKLRNFGALMQVISEELTEIGLHGAGAYRIPLLSSPRANASGFYDIHRMCK